MRPKKKLRRPVILPREIWGEVDRLALKDDREWMDMMRVLIKESLARRARAAKRVVKKGN